VRDCVPESITHEPSVQALGVDEALVGIGSTVRACKAISAATAAVAIQGASVLAGLGLTESAGKASSAGTDVGLTGASVLARLVGSIARAHQNAFYDSGHMVATVVDSLTVVV
jgi:hypothetical protein